MTYHHLCRLGTRLLYQSLTLFTLWTGTGMAETLVVLGDDSYPPVIHMQSGVPSGFLVTILDRASALTGDRYEIHLSPWKRAYEKAIRSEGGVVGISLTQERAKLFDFSKPIYDDDIQIVTLATKSFPYTRLEDLRGKTIGGVLGASYGESVDSAIAGGLFIVERDVSQTGRLRKLLAGRLDAAFIGNGLAGFESVINSQDDLRTNRALFSILPTPIARDPLHLAFAKNLNKREALDRFDAAVDKLRKSGELKRLANSSITAK